MRFGGDCTPIAHPLTFGEPGSLGNQEPFQKSIQRFSLGFPTKNGIILAMTVTIFISGLDPRISLEHFTVVRDNAKPLKKLTVPECGGVDPNPNPQPTIPGKTMKIP